MTETKMTLELTDKEYRALQEMVDHYYFHQREVYSKAPPEKIFTNTQFDLFSKLQIND